MSALCQNQGIFKKKRKKRGKKRKKKRKEGEEKRAYIDGSGDESRP